jgi:stage V sporulation protein R
MKTRRDVYFDAGRQDLWCWAVDEVRRELVAIQALLDFRERYRAGSVTSEPIPLEPEWYTWAQRHSDRIELGVGTSKIFEVRNTHDDVMFLDEFFTQEFCEQQQYFLYKAREVWNSETYDMESRYVIDSTSFRRIKRRLMWQYTNFCMPTIEVVDANYDNQGALYLVHRHEGVDLDFWSKDARYMHDVLRFLFYIFGGKNWVYLETVATQTEKDEPIWFNWHYTEEKETDEDDQEILGNVIIFGYGLDEAGNESFLVDVREDEVVMFKAPF